jgi:7-dehydrocholesterol reductase
MAYQYQTFGYVTKSMLLVNFFHFVYVLDFFYNEDWYLRTIDISHDHFGWTLSWGDMCLLPNRESSRARLPSRSQDRPHQEITLQTSS